MMMGIVERQVGRNMLVKDVCFYEKRVEVVDQPRREQ